MNAARPASESDLSRLAHIWYERLALESLPRGTALRPDARQHLEETLREWLAAPDVRIMVAEADGAVGGFAAAGIVSAPPGLLPEKRGEIRVLTLDGHAYHPGAGRTLIGAVQSWFREQGIALVSVTVSKSNPVDQAFWRSVHGEVWSDTFWWTW